MASGFIQKHFNWILFLAAGIFWGASIPLTIVAASGDAHPQTLVFWATVIGLALLTVWMIFNRVRLPVTLSYIKFYFVVGLFGTVIPNSFGYWAAPHLTASEMAIIYSLVPIITFAFAIILRQETFVLRRMTGVLIGLVAMLLLILPDADSASGNIFWALVIFVACISYSIETVFIAAKMPDDAHPLTMLCGMFIAALIMLVPMMLWTGTSFNFFGTGSWPEIAVVCVAVIHVFCYAALLALIQRTGSIFASQLTYVITLSGIFLGIIFLGDRLSVWTWAALAVAMVGIWLVRPDSE